MGKIRWPLRVRVSSTNVATGYRLPILSLKIPVLSTAATTSVLISPATILPADSWERLPGESPKAYAAFCLNGWRRRSGWNMRLWD